MSHPQYPQGPQGPQGQFNQPGAVPQGGAPQGGPQYPQGGAQYPQGGAQYPQGGTPYGGPAPVAPAKKNPLMKFVPLLIGLAVILGGGILVNKLTGGPALKVGNCITLEKQGTDDFKETKVDCGDTSQFTFTIVKETKTKSECGDTYSTYTVKKGSNTKYYCLMDNWQEGKCYKKASGNKAGDEIVACGRSADFKIVKRIDGSADPKACSARQKAAVFDIEPQRTYCLGDPTR